MQENDENDERGNEGSGMEYVYDWIKLLGAGRKPKLEGQSLKNLDEVKNLLLRWHMTVLMRQNALFAMRICISCEFAAWKVVVCWVVKEITGWLMFVMFWKNSWSFRCLFGSNFDWYEDPGDCCFSFWRSPNALSVGTCGLETTLDWESWGCVSGHSVSIFVLLRCLLLAFAWIQSSLKGSRVFKRILSIKYEED